MMNYNVPKYPTMPHEYPKRWCNNTKVHTSDYGFIITYKVSDVVVYANGSHVSFNMDGWFTNNTRHRMNKFLDYAHFNWQVKQKDWKCFLEHTPSGRRILFNGDKLGVPMGLLDESLLNQFEGSFDDKFDLYIMKRKMGI